MKLFTQVSSLKISNIQQILIDYHFGNPKLGKLQNHLFTILKAPEISQEGYVRE